MEKYIRILMGYFEEKLPNLEESYSWLIPDIKDVPYANSRGYKDNVALKYYLHNQWHSADIDGKKRVADIIVNDWGGIRTNKPETMQLHINRALSSSPDFPLAGVASYSKIQSIVDYQAYAIYDARVAACLNAVQINYGEKKIGNPIPVEGLAFCYVEGRNNITGNTGNKNGFAQQENFKIRNLVKNGWKPISRNQCYQTYLKTLHACLKNIHEIAGYEEFHLYDLEMVLFSNAEIECKAAMRSINPDNYPV